MTGLWLTVVNMGVTGTLAALAVIFFRSVLGKKLPRGFSYALWGIVLFRLLLPFSFSSPLSILDKINPKIGQYGGPLSQGLWGAFGVAGSSEQDLTSFHAASATGNGTGAMYSGMQTMSGVTKAIGGGSGDISRGMGKISGAGAEILNGLESSLHHGSSLLAVCSIIWILGAVLLLSYSVLSYVRLMGKVSTSTRLKEEALIDFCRRKVGLTRSFQVYVSDQISSPFLCGIWHPRIILPRFLMDGQTDEGMLRFILLHEMVHIRRFDFILKPLAFLALAIHWFNPAIWVCFQLADKDMEMSCDERVIKLCETDQRVNYADTLLALSMKQNHLAAGGLPAFGETGVKVRVKNILKYKSPKKWVTAVCILLIVVGGIFLLSNPPGIAGFQNGRISALLIGGVEKPSEKTTSADTFILMSYEPKKKDLNVAFIPRNTLISTEGRVMELGQYSAEHSPEQTLAQVNQLLGTQVGQYVKVDTGALREMVNAMDGIEFYVPEDMYYEDPMSQPPFQIALKKGEQTLDGKQAEMLVRFRKGYPQGDLTRIQVEQQVLEAILTQEKGSKLLQNTGELFRFVSKNVKTNMNKNQLAQCFKAARKASIQKENIKEIHLPITLSEEYGIPKVTLEKEKAQQLVKDQF